MTLPGLKLLANRVRPASASTENGSGAGFTSRSCRRNGEALPLDSREYFAEKYLKGEGIEFGALHKPLPVNKDQCSVRYVDRHPVQVVLRLFPELKREAHRIVRPDFLLNLDCDDFHVLRDRRYDFFIANHVIEHLVNPLRFLEKLNTVMAQGSILYLAVPDKRYTFDVNRAITSSEHLWQDYLQNTQDLSEEHLLDFLVGITKDHVEPSRRARMYFNRNWLPWNWDSFARKRLYRLHRRRSIHVHVWDQPAFDELLAMAIERVPLQLRIVEQRRARHRGPRNALHPAKNGRLRRGAGSRRSRRVGPASLRCRPTNAVNGGPALASSLVPPYGLTNLSLTFFCETDHLATGKQ